MRGNTLRAEKPSRRARALPPPPWQDLVYRAKDADFLNTIVNHPDVRPDVADLKQGKLDLSAAVANRNNVLLVGAHGACFCAPLQPGVYEVHTQSLPEGRGRWILDFVRAGASWMFCNTDAYEIVTRVPRKHHAARWLTLQAGMKFEFSRDEFCRFRGADMPVDIYSFRIQDWCQKADGLEAAGAWLHEAMAREARRVGITTPPHDDDPNHNRYVGATFLMVKGEQPVKGISFFNRWACLARHAPVQLLSAKPPRIKFDVGVLGFDGNGIRIEP